MDKPFAPMPPLPVAPLVRAPAGACDTHAHMLAAPEDFPLWDGRVENPAQGIDFKGWIDRYKNNLNSLGCTRGVVVHSILYGSDNSVTVEALRRLGLNFRGIGLLCDGAGEREVKQFVDWNMVGIRLNYVHGGVLSWSGAKELAPVLAANGLHIQMLMHAHLHMDEIAEDIGALQVPVCFDHIGWPDLSLGVDHKGIKGLCRLLETGKVWVKLSGLYRLSNAPYEQTDEIVAALVSANPERCLWGSDWPHIMLNGAEMPKSGEMLDALQRVVSKTATQRRILVENPKVLYGFSDCEA